jgi:hypothetical protein
VAFAAKVVAVAPGTGIPTGSVTFKDGATILATLPLNASGVAIFTTSGLAVGVHSLTAVYGGSGNFNGSTSAALSHTVNKANTTTALTSSLNPSVHGQAVTFTAGVHAVAPGGGIPTGSVTFKDGATILATVPLNASGAATFTTSALAVGNHTITASYGGSVSFNASTSSGITQTVH